MSIVRNGTLSSGMVRERALALARLHRRDQALLGVLVQPVERQHVLVGLERGVVALLLQPLVGERQAAPGSRRPGPALALGAHLAHHHDAAAVQLEEQRRGLELGAPQLEADLGQRSCRPRPGASAWLSAGVAPGGGAPLTLNVVPMLGNTSRIRAHSSTRRMPSRITGVTGVSNVMRMSSGNSPSLNSNWPSGHRKRSKIVSSALALSARFRSSSPRTPSATRIEPSSRPFSSWASSALKSCSSVTRRSADQELAERLARVVRPGREDVALAQDDALLDRAPLDVQGARLLTGGDPLQDVGQRHRAQVAAEAHRSGVFRGGRQLSSQERSQNR